MNDAGDVRVCQGIIGAVFDAVGADLPQDRSIRTHEQAVFEHFRSDMRMRWQDKQLCQVKQSALERFTRDVCAWRDLDLEDVGRIRRGNHDVGP